MRARPSSPSPRRRPKVRTIKKLRVRTIKYKCQLILFSGPSVSRHLDQIPRSWRQVSKTLLTTSPTLLQVASDVVRPHVRPCPPSRLHPLCRHLLGHRALLLLHLARNAGAVHRVKNKTLLNVSCLSIHFEGNKSCSAGHDTAEPVWTLLLGSFVMSSVLFLDRVVFIDISDALTFFLFFNQYLGIVLGII